MNLSSTTWRCIIVLLTFSVRGCPLLPADCMKFIPLGYLMVERAPPFLLGSDLTVYCHINECDWGSKMFLELDGANVNLSKRLNCTSTVFHVAPVRPRSSVVCKLMRAHMSALNVVNGLDLQAGHEPKNIICETTRSSEFVVCSWQKGGETYLDKYYNISLVRLNGTQVLLEQIKDAEEISIPQAILVENTKYELIITAYNYLGKSQSEPFILCVQDVVIPETPRIVKVEFGSNFSAVLHWETSTRLRTHTRLRADNGSWEMREGTQLGEGLIQVDSLRPLAVYEFQMRVCDAASGLTDTNTSRWTVSHRATCSRWSPSVMTRSPGKSLSQPLHVWRTVGTPQDTNGLKNVTVLWKPPAPEDYSGELQQYKIFVDDDREETCTAASSQCSVQVPAGNRMLSVSAVTSYGTSPPAEVEIRYSGLLGPILREFAPSANGNAVLVSWTSTLEELLYYVMEWTSVPAGRLQWRKLTKDLTNTSVTGLTAGVRYNVSLYAVTTRGVSAPSSTLIYSREQRPLSSPTLHVLAHETKRILVQWDEPPVDQQRGFITKYTVYLQTLDSSNSELNVTVSGSGWRRMWLDCPEGALALQLTASNAAGEGPRGTLISSHPAAPAVGLVIVMVFITAIFIVIVTNLLCCGCVRERIKQKCVSWGPSWLVGNLPKPGRSNAIRLLTDNRSEPIFSSTDSDPPLSPIIMLSQEMDEVYPTIQVEVSQTGSEQTAAGTSLSMTDSRTILVEDGGYKPQIISLFPLEEVQDAEERDVPAHEEENSCSNEGLLGSFLSGVDVNFSGSSQGPTLSSVGVFLWPQAGETSVLTKVVLQETTHGDDMADFRCLDLKQDGSMATDTVGNCSSAGETTLNGGYLPQPGSAPCHSAHRCDRDDGSDTNCTAGVCKMVLKEESL
ncbi:interleukin-23 receptor isoform X2 [Cololabis saira]|uniref:interleukin-23 receptor isoform X2 n=1 Tax=Cololabis saira TaxID=129043 RepID=UPI002AD5A0EA|nr:interleukin-23 receptor isoform X2 [Cololabis saira]